jgi:diguanylate cyclase (GGDEF)-like protein
VLLLGTPLALLDWSRIAPFPAGTVEVRSTPVIPSSGASVPARMRPNDAYFELIADTLDGLESTPRAQFLQRFFFSLAHVEIPENQAISLWDEVLARRIQLSERTDSPVAFQTALVDVLSSTGMFRVPVVLEYDEFKTLHRSAVTDPLTGLYNRRLFNETFEKELNRARRYAHPLSLVILDLHRFKEVNDQYGHPRGDEVLHAAATTLRKALRTSDFAFRIGGDEFALLLPQTDSAQASALSRRIGVVFAEILRPLELMISVTMDHGVSTYPQDGEGRELLIRIADERLYTAKQGDHQKTDAELRTAVPPAPEASSSVASKVSEPLSEPIDVPAPATAPVSEPSPEVAPSPAPEVVSPAAPSVSPLQASQPSFRVVPEEPRIYTVPRKAERVSMAGTNAYAVLGDQPAHRARVVDLGFGGVALDFPRAEGIPDMLLAVLHVPILPPVRVNLKRVWSRQLSEDTIRVGCCFVS